jgi:hypothetical protein
MLPLAAKEAATVQHSYSKVIMRSQADTAVHADLRPDTITYCSLMEALDVAGSQTVELVYPVSRMYRADSVRQSR